MWPPGLRSSGGPIEALVMPDRDELRRALRKTPFLRPEHVGLSPERPAVQEAQARAGARSPAGRWTPAAIAWPAAVPGAPRYFPCLRPPAGPPERGQGEPNWKREERKIMAASSERLKALSFHIRDAGRYLTSSVALH